MKQSTKTKRLAACLLALSLAAAGCGNGDEQKEPEAESSETIGAGADMKVASDTESDAKAEKPLQSIAKVTIGDINGDESTIHPTIVNFAEEPVEASLQGFLLDGVAVEEWHVSETVTSEANPSDSASFPLEYRIGRSLPIVLNANIYDYSEITVQASISFGDGREPLPISASFQISELERVEDMKATAPAQASTPMLHVEEQELLNENGIVVTLPEQMQKNSAYLELELHAESSIEHTMFISFMNVTVNGEMIAKGSPSISDAELIPGESDFFIYIGDCIDFDMASGEISFVLFITEDQRNAFAEPVITIPYTITTE